MDERIYVVTYREGCDPVEYMSLELACSKEEALRKVKRRAHHVAIVNVRMQ